MRSALALVLVACGSSRAAPQQVTIAAASASSSSAPVVAPRARNAREAYDAAEALDRDGRINEARIAYQEIIQTWAYSLPARDARQRLAQLDAQRTVGDVTCGTDADCAVTTKRDCCECCPRRALATSKKWLVWRDGQCAATRCEGCDKTCEPETGATAACRAGKCELTKK